jgi:AraC-like DNA-binding protein
MADFTAHKTGHDQLQAVSGESDHHFPRHTHDDFGIGLMVAGGQISASGRGQVEAGPGDIITVNPGEVHDGVPVGRHARRWHMLYLAPALLQDIANGLGVCGQGDLEFCHPVLTDTNVAQHFATAWRRGQNQPSDNTQGLAREEALLQLLCGLLSRRSSPEHMRQAPLAMLRVKAMIDDDVLDNPSLGDLAREAGLSRFQTLRAFARLTGFTPHAYLVEQRVRHARRQVIAGMRLADAAAASGFADQSHMTREFRRRYGVTPAVLRNAVTGCNFVQDRSFLQV